MQISRFLFLLLSFLLVGQVFSQDEQTETETEKWAPGEYMRQATDNTFEKANLMSSLSDFKLSDNLAMGGAIIEVGATISLEIELESGKEYTFIGGGDSDVTDLDMYIVDESGEVVASDTEDDDTPIPDMTAAYTGRYTLRMQLVSGEAATSFISFVMMTKDGNGLEKEAFDGASDVFFATGEALHNKTEGIKWHDMKNQWCYYGALLGTNESWDFDNLNLGSESQIIFASCRENDVDINLVLKDKSGTTIAEDTADDSVPVITIDASETKRYTLDVSNVRSNNPIFIMVAIVTQ